MVRIGICDDEPSSAEQIERLVKEYFNNTEHGCSIRKFADPVELLTYLENRETYDILILDVYMPVMLGTEVAKELRNRGDQTRIIFLTTSTDHAIDAFAVRASDYILKPAKKEAVFKALDEIISKINDRDNRMFSVKTSEGLVNIRIHTISFIELAARRLCIHTWDGEVIMSRVIRDSFEECVAEVFADPAFVHCQKSFVVNMNHVKGMNAERFLLRDGTEIPISKKFYQDTKKRYMEFLLREEG